MKVSNLYIYPIKSLRAIEVQQAQLTPLGLQWDRQWMLINEKDQSITQRTHPEMALIDTRISGDFLYVSKEGSSEIKIPLEGKNEQKRNKSFTANIWSDACQVFEPDESFSDWFTQVLGSREKIRLVTMAANHSRPQSNADRFGQHTTTQFADAVSYLITTQASLNRLNDILIENNHIPSKMLQFRPNIVLENSDQQELPPFQEHQISTFQNQKYALKSCDPCQRCVVPTIDIETAKKHPQFEPYNTLIGLNPMPDNPKAPAFGQNAILQQADSSQVIKIGDLIEAK